MLKLRIMINYKEGVCKGCSDNKLIVYKSGFLCMTCNRDRLNNRYSDRAKSRVSKPYKALKRTQIKPVTKKSLVKIKADDKMYELVWNSRAHFCEECGLSLGDRFRGDNGRVLNRFIYSHILTKGAYPEHRHNLMNFNLLCLKHHQEWENGDKKKMNIWGKNQLIIEKLKKNGRNKF